MVLNLCVYIYRIYTTNNQNKQILSTNATRYRNQKIKIVWHL